MPDQFQNRGEKKTESKFVCYDSFEFLVGILCDRNDISVEALAASLLNYIK